MSSQAFVRNSVMPSPLACASIYEFFNRTATQFPDRPFFQILPETAQTYGIEAEEITYREMHDKILAQKQKYAQSGYGKSHRIGLLLENRPDFFVHWFALNALGAVVVPINPDLKIFEIEYLVSHSEMVLALTIAHRKDDLQQAGMNMTVTLTENLPQAQHPAPDNYIVSPQDEAALLYTSGTTGLPKGCVLSQEYFLNCGDWYLNVGGYCRLKIDGERMLTPLPLFHTNAMVWSTMGMIAVGGCLIVLDRFHPKSWWESVRLANASVVHYLGVMPAMLMNIAESPEDKNHQLRFAFGAGVEPELHAPFEERFGVKLIEAWAMTETGCGGTIAVSDCDRHVGTRCFGKPSPEVEAKIDAGDGLDAADGVQGELLVRHAGDNPRFGFFSHYLKNEEATNQAWEGGWFHTGDVVKRNPDGTLCFVDRMKNVIRRSGENIAAIEVEAAFLRHPDIASIAIAPVPDAIRGDEVFACIIPKQRLKPEEKQPFAEKLMGWGLERLAYYKLPGHIAFVDSLPITSTNKVQRGKLKEMTAELVKQPDTLNMTHLKKRKNK